MKNVITVILFFLLLFLCHSLAYTQHNRTNFFAGFGTYDLYSLKEFQENLINEGFPFAGIRAVDVFPDYFNWMISQERFFNPQHSLSFDFSYLYTGGRNSLTDYSGRYLLDLFVNSYRLGLSYTHYANEKFGNDKLNGFIRIRSGWSRSNFQIIEEININNSDLQLTRLDYFSDSFYVEFSPGITYNITSYLVVSLSFGYEFEPSAKLKSGENFDASIDNLIIENIKTNWQGLRFRSGIGVNLGALIEKIDK